MNALDLVRAATEPKPTPEWSDMIRHNKAVWATLGDALRRKPATAIVRGTKLILAPLGNTDLFFMYVNDTEDTRNVVAMYTIDNPAHGFHGDRICVDPAHGEGYESLNVPETPTPANFLRVIFADASRRRPTYKAHAAVEPETDTRSGVLLVQALNTVYKKLEIVAAPGDRKLRLDHPYVDVHPPHRDVFFGFVVPGIPRPGSEHDRPAGHYHVQVRRHKFSLNGRDGYGELLQLPAATTQVEANKAAMEILKAVTKHRSDVTGLTHTLRRRDNQALAAAEPQAHRKDAALTRAVQLVIAAMAKEPKRVRTLEVPRISGPVKVKVRLAVPRFGSRRGAGLNEDGMLCLEATWPTSTYTAYVSLFHRHDESVVVTFQIKGRKNVDLDALPTPTRPAEVLPFLAKLFVDQILGPDKHQETMELTAAAEPPPATGRMSISFRRTGAVGRARAFNADLKASGITATVKRISDHEIWVNFRMPVNPERFKTVLGVLKKHDTEKHPILIFTGRGCYGVAQLPGNAMELWESFKSTTSEADA